MSDELLDFLGDAFEENELHERGWTFAEFIKEYQLGFISIEGGETH